MRTCEKVNNVQNHDKLVKTIKILKCNKTYEKHTIIKHSYDIYGNTTHYGNVSDIMKRVRKHKNN